MNEVDSGLCCTSSGKRFTCDSHNVNRLNEENASQSWDLILKSMIVSELIWAEPPAKFHNE